MALINFNADVRIKVVFPYVTKSLKDTDRSRVTATGSFTYEPRPQVESAHSVFEDTASTVPLTVKQRSINLQSTLGDLLAEIAKIKKFMAKKAKNIIFQYDPVETRNESYADAEETLFGVASGVIDYGKFEKILELEEKIDRWIAHQSIANGGTLNGIQ